MTNSSNAEIQLERLAGFELAEKEAAIKNKIIANLEAYGVHWDEQNKSLEADNFKQLQKKLAEQTNPQGDKYKERVANFLATPDEINISQIFPDLVVVNQSQEHKQLWAYASSFWSVPITVPAFLTPKAIGKAKKPTASRFEPSVCPC